MHRKFPIPAGTPIVAVDPLRDFIDEDGIFNRWAVGLSGDPGETREIRNLPKAMSAALNAWKGKLFRVLVRSEYPYDRWNKPGLEKLCTTEEGRTSAIDQSHFDHTMTKTDNSILAASAEDLKFLENQTHVILSGVTTTSCVKLSIEQLLEERRELQLIVFRNLVAARKSEREKAQRVLDMKHPNLTVMDNWKEAEIAHS